MAELRKRRNAFDVGNPWVDPVLWYARAVKAMMARPFEDPTSWRFFAAIHGISRRLWERYAIVLPTDPNPAQSDVAAYLNQCQHQSWYFLPWHRGYLLAVEKLLREEIRSQGGPHETWALPYWNYFGNGENILPPAFTSKGWPDGPEDNPLYVEQRYGEIVTEAPFDISSVTNLNSLEDADFFGPGGGATAGFGGPVTAFNWNAGTNGALESDPHNQIHGLVGGEHPTLRWPNGAPLPGLMGSPVSAALDPIFYLHHCNIDRLWESWNRFPAGKVSRKPTDWRNPVNPLWLRGPPDVGQHEFAMPDLGGGKWIYTPEEMADIALLGYEYESLVPGADVSTDPLRDRLATLGIPFDRAVRPGVSSMGSTAGPEMIGAGDGLSLVGVDPVRTAVRTVPAVRERVMNSLSAATEEMPDRVFLNLENITGLSDAVIFKVYVGLPVGASGSARDRYFAGSVSTFGVAQASDHDGPHVGDGVTYTIEITKIIDRLHVSGEFDTDDLSIEFVPLRNILKAANIRIGRVSIFRQAP